MHPAVIDSTGLDDQTTLLKAVPDVLTWPGGRLYCSYLIFRADWRARRALALIKKAAGGDKFMTFPLEDRQHWAAISAQTAAGYRDILAKLESFDKPGWLLGRLIAHLEETANGYSDLSETFALGADPEIGLLAKELNDAL